MSFYAEALVGFRSWRIDACRVCLQGKIVVSDWPFDKEAKAECVETLFPGAICRQSHEAPFMRCTCGLHAYKTQADMEKRHVEHSRNIAGAVMAWGRVCLHEKGWRSEFARPLALIKHQPVDEPSWDKLYERVAENYRIPIVNRLDLQDYALTFGSLAVA